MKSVVNSLVQSSGSSGAKKVVNSLANPRGETPSWFKTGSFSTIQMRGIPGMRPTQAPPMMRKPIPGARAPK